MIVLSEPVIVKSSINDSFSIKKQEQVIWKNAKKSFNPTSPSFIKNIDWSNDIYAETSGVWGRNYTETLIL